MYAFQPGVCDGIFARFQEATKTNRNKHASTSMIRNKAECEAAAHQEHCHNAFKQCSAYGNGSHIDK